MRVSSRVGFACALLLALLLPVLLLLPVSAAGTELPDTSEASAVYFYHMESGRRIGARNETQVLPAGSTVKLLSGLIACERLQGQLGDIVQITEEMIDGVSGHRYQLEEGELYTMEQLLYLAVCGSYNDAYNTLAYIIGGGNVQEFVNLMNQRAAELGARSTTATDPTGIADSSLTTAEDLFCIALSAVQNPLYMQICGSAFYDMPAGRIYNRNALVSAATENRYYNPYCRGLTAGSTPLGQASVITLAQKENDSYLCVVLGARDESDKEGGENYSYVVANRLIDWGYDNFRYLEVLTPESVVCTLPVTVSDMTDSVEVVPAEPLSLYVPVGAQPGRDLTFSIRLMYDALEAPVQPGMHVGYVAVVYDGEILGTAALYTAGSAERSSFISRLMQIQSLTQSRRVRAGGIFFLVALTAWLLTEALIARYRRHKWDKYFSRKIDMSETLLRRRPPDRRR